MTVMTLFFVLMLLFSLRSMHFYLKSYGCCNLFVEFRSPQTFKIYEFENRQQAMKKFN